MSWRLPMRRLLVAMSVTVLVTACGSAATPSPTTSMSPPAASPSTTTPSLGATGSMTTYRVFGTATPLAGGSVLLVGGFDASAELYDPLAGTFRAAGTLPTDLSFLTATLLADGRVLVAGGAHEFWPTGVASAEVYDPATGKLSPAGPMTTPRALHTATLLADGRVLLVGGDGGSGPEASAELFDPRSGKFAATGSMTTPRSGATASGLPDGRVLVAGGTGDGASPLASAEVYDPRTGTFSATGSLTFGRFNHTATTLPDGRILLAGGFGADWRASVSAEIYDPTTGTFAATGSMHVARAFQSATPLPDGRVLLAGGMDGGSSSASATTTEIYDPKTGTFTEASPMLAPRAGQAAALMSDGRVLLAGGSSAGFDTGAGLPSAELYDPGAGTSSLAGVAMPTVGEAADDGARIVNVTKVDARTRDLTIESPAVGRTVKVRLLVPNGFDAQPSATWPVLYLLSGASGTYVDITDATDAEALTAATNLLVVMPDAGTGGYYSDWWNGGKGGPPAWETFHLIELRQLLERNWHAGDKRAVAGLSMGGYGAMEYAERQPGMFLAAASYSGVVDLIGASTTVLRGWSSGPWGDAVSEADVWKAHDPTTNAAALKGKALYVAYGNGQPGPLDSAGTTTDYTEAGLATLNKTFVHQLEALGIPVTVDAYGPGTHNYPYFERDLQRSLPLLLKALGE